MKPLVMISFLFAALLATSDLRAQPAPWSNGRDVVTLRDGTNVEGQAIDIRLGEQVTMRLPDGELRIIRWTDVASARGASFEEALRASAAPVNAPATTIAAAASATASAAAPATEPATAPATEPATAPASPRSAVAQLPPPPPAGDELVERSNSGAVVRRSVAGRYMVERPGTVPVVLHADSVPLMISAIVEARGLNARFAAFPTPAPHGIVDTVPPPLMDPYTPTVRTEYLCTTPCTLYLSPGRTTLHVGGVGRLESIQTLDVGPHGQRVLLYSSSSSMFGSGVLLTLFGASIGIGGSFALLIDQSGAGTTTTGLPLSTIGLIGMAIGSIALAIGIPIVASTHVGVERSERHPASPVAASQRWRLLGGGISPAPRGDGVMAGIALGF